MDIALAPTENDARQMVERFVRRFGESYRLLACHAALPLILTPELLHYLRNTFLRGQVPWVAEVDLLLSELCQPVGYEQYAMNQAVRAFLIAELRTRTGERRLQDVARLLMSYVHYLYQTGSLFNASELQAQQLAAMVCLDEQREQAISEIIEAFEQNMKTAASSHYSHTSKAELARLTHLIANLAPQLEKHTELVEYANLVAKMLTDPANAIAKANDRLYQKVRVLDRELPAPIQLTDQKMAFREPVYDRRIFVGREELIQEIIEQALGPQANIQQYRSQLIEGPARRGKTWLLYRVGEILVEQSPAIVCFFSKNDAHYPNLNHYFLAAKLWLSLRNYVPSHLWPTSFSNQAPEAQQLQELHDFLQHTQPDPTRCLETFVSLLEQTDEIIYLIVLVDALDSFERQQLELFELRFLAQLFNSSKVRLIATRRSEVITHSWKSYQLRLHTHRKSLRPFNSAEAIQQFNHLLNIARLSLDFSTDLQPLFRYYSGQNPGANTFFIKKVRQNYLNEDTILISADDIKDCILELSRSGRHSAAISATDLDWLTTVVHNFPSIGSTSVPHPGFSKYLTGTSDKVRNDWLGRLQDRGIVVMEINGLVRVHEEFVALCQDFEAKRVRPSTFEAKRVRPSTLAYQYPDEYANVKFNTDMISASLSGTFVDCDFSEVNIISSILSGSFQKCNFIPASDMQRREDNEWSGHFVYCRGIGDTA
jgi:hypothetical protein